MKKIKYYRKTKENYIHKIHLNEEKIQKEDITVIEEKQKIELQETQVAETNCFALVVVRKLPWYKKFVRSIRNFIVIYRWRKAR